MLIIGYIFFKNYKLSIYLFSTASILTIIYSTHKYRNNFHFSPNCEISRDYSDSLNIYSTQYLGWDVLHPPYIIKFYSLPCSLFDDFKIMNLALLILLIAVMFFVNRNKDNGHLETLFELTFFLSVIRIFEGHMFLYILPFAYYSLKNLFFTNNRWNFFIVGFILGFRILPFLILMPIVFKFYRQNIKFYIFGGVLPFVPISTKDINIYSEFLDNLLSQRILTLSNSYFAQNIWNTGFFKNMNQNIKYFTYFLIFLLFCLFVYLNENKTIIFAFFAFLIAISPRAVPYEMIILIPTFAKLYKKYFYIFLSLKLFGSDYVLFWSILWRR